MPKPRFAPPAPRKKSFAGFNPVRAALAIHEADQETRDIELLCLAADDGQEMRSLIADAAFVVGVGTEISIALDKHSPQSKRLHGALRALVAMACNECKWVKAQALSISNAVEESMRLAGKHGHMGLAFIETCVNFSNAIKQGTITADMLAGTELYKEPDTQGAYA